MLFHVPIIGNPEVAERTMIAELEANSWYAQPSFPCVKMLKADLLHFLPQKRQALPLVAAGWEQVPARQALEQECHSGPRDGDRRLSQCAGRGVPALECRAG